MNQNQESLNTWNKVADLYQQKFMDLDIYNSSYRLFCDMIQKPDAVVMDLACGPGNISKYLLVHRPDFQIHGFDTASNMIELAKKNNPRATYSVLDIREIHTLGVRYDGIMCGFGLPYLNAEECRKFILDAFQLLNTGGVLYLSFVAGDPNQSGFKTSSGDRVYFNYHPLEKIRQHLVQVGFETPELISVKYPNKNGTEDIHSILVLKKP